MRLRLYRLSVLYSKSRRSFEDSVSYSSVLSSRFRWTVHAIHFPHEEILTSTTKHIKRRSIIRKGTQRGLRPVVLSSDVGSPGRVGSHERAAQHRCSRRPRRHRATTRRRA